MGVISGVAFATILAVVAGLTITASASFAHDVYNSILKDGKADPAQEVRVARITSVVVGVLAILGGIAANGQNIAFLISPAISGSPGSMLGEGIDFSWFPLDNPALVSVPLAFLAGFLGTVTSSRRGDEEFAIEMEVRSMTGAGAGEAIVH